MNSYIMMIIFLFVLNCAAIHPTPNPKFCVRTHEGSKTIMQDGVKKKILVVRKIRCTCMNVESGILDWSSQVSSKRMEEESENSDNTSRPGKKVGYGCHVCGKLFKKGCKRGLCKSCKCKKFAHKTCTEFCSF